MTKQERTAQLLNARFKALDAYYLAQRQLAQVTKDLETIDTALESMRDLVDAPAKDNTSADRNPQ